MAVVAMRPALARVEKRILKQVKRLGFERNMCKEWYQRLKTEINRLEKLGSAGSDCLVKRREWTDPSRTFKSSIRLLVVVFGDDGERKIIVKRELKVYLCLFPDRRIKQTLQSWWRCILTTTSQACQACRSMLQQQTAPSIPSLPFRSSVHHDHVGSQGRR